MEFSPLDPYSLGLVHDYSINIAIIDDDAGIKIYSPVIDFHISSDDNSHHLVSMITDIRDSDPKRAVKLASDIAEGFTQNFNSEILLFGQTGKEIEGVIDFTLDDILNSSVYKYKNIKPMEAVWANHFFVTVHTMIKDDVTVYTPSISLNTRGIDGHDHAVTLVTAIQEDNINDAAAEAISVGLRLAVGYKEDIILIDASGKITNHVRKVSDYLEELGFDKPDVPKYLH
jgi:hypothetical protein